MKKEKNGYYYLKRILAYSRPYKKMVIWTVLVTIISSILSPLRPYLLKLMVDKAIAAKNLDALNVLFGITLSVLLFETIIQFFQTYFSNLLAQNIIFDIRKDVYNRLLKFKTFFFNKTPVGTLVTRVVSDIETIADVFSQGLLIMSGDILQIFLVLVFMFYTDWKLAIISLLPIPLMIWSTNVFRKFVKRSFQEVRTQISRLNAFVNEHVSGMAIVQLFNSEAKEFKKFEKINKEHRDAHIKTVWAYSVFFPVVEMLSALSLALLVWVGARGVLDNYVSPGDLVAFILYIYMLYRPIRILADRFNTLQMGLVSAERIFKLMDDNENLEPCGNYKKDKLTGKLYIDHLSFGYSEETLVLQEILLKVEPGEMLAVVGKTGSGKTTLVNLLLKMYPVPDGKIFIDDIDINRYDNEFLRSRIAYVPQDVFLFSGSIYDNVTMFNPGIAPDDVVKAAKEIGIHEFIVALPEGYHYKVKERGQSLSLGQRQLIAFLRAYIANPDILILDEATSSVDSETELLIKKATGKITQDRTSIIIAHRISTITRSDKIIVLDKGRIVEEGTHKDLLQKGKYYKKLYELQFSEIE
ncbi:MAG: xenobiotic ABC transporter ATP-binding protein [Vicingaceae bacterium]|nr:MAG: xenobiotic ABC transporter ATP-binding protein [Vicingaceae bacterium]